MNTIKVTLTDRKATITLSRGRSNPINLEMVTELTTAVQQLETDDAVGGVIVTGTEGFFSAGIDLVEAYEYDQEQSKALWTAFLKLQAILVGFKKPLVAAITGHSPAGGCIIALCCDYRVMASGRYIIGLNEIPVGIIVPDTVFNLYSFWLGKRVAYQSLMEGKLFSVDEALAGGLVDHVCEPVNVLAEADKKLSAYLKLNPFTWSQSKLNLRKELIAQGNADQTDTLTIMLKQWWAPETRMGLQMMVEKLKSPSAK